MHSNTFRRQILKPVILAAKSKAVFETALQSMRVPAAA